MAKTTTKAKKATPADEAQGKALLAHEVIRSPSVQNAIGMYAWGKFAGEPDLSALVLDLQTRTEKVQAGDLRQLEAMLFGQAMTLQTIFTATEPPMNPGRFSTTTEFGPLKELVCFKFTIGAVGASATGWALFRMLSPVWFDAVKA